MIPGWVPYTTVLGDVLAPNFYTLNTGSPLDEFGKPGPIVEAYDQRSAWTSVQYLNFKFPPEQTCGGWKDNTQTGAVGSYAIADNVHLWGLD